MVLKNKTISPFFFNILVYLFLIEIALIINFSGAVFISIITIFYIIMRVHKNEKKNINNYSNIDTNNCVK